MLIFLIPVSMIMTPQIHDTELFFSIEDLRIPTESMKTQGVIKKPSTVSVKEINNLAEVPGLQIKKPEIIESVRENGTEPVREIEKKPTEKVNAVPIKDESPNPLTNEKRKVHFISTFTSTMESQGYAPAKVASEGQGRAFAKNSPMGEQSLSGSRSVTADDPGIPIETSFGATIAPAFLHREIPLYPIIARRLGKEGKVVLRLTIDEMGILINVEVLEKAGYGFTEAAIEAVKKSTFLPAKKDGKPIACRAILPIRFQLKKE